MQFLTANGDTFIAPHYEVAAGWVCPSLVALRPARKQIWVADVSASGYPLGLVDRINQRVEKWYAPLLEQLQRLQVVQGDWSIGLLIFVRDDQVEWLKGRVKDWSGVHVLSLETASSPWTWHSSVWTEDVDFATGAIARKDEVTSGPALTH
ncbi:MAG: hypothetical protein RR943_07780 [Comamonas sp.]